MADIPTNFGSGGSGLTPNDSAGSPSLKTILDALNSDAAWTTGITVSSHAATLATAGFVIAVEATTATSAGAKQMQYSASPAAGYVRVEYSDAGVATLTFNATDAVTECAVVVIPRSASLL